MAAVPFAYCGIFEGGVPAAHGRWSAREDGRDVARRRAGQAEGDGDVQAVVVAVQQAAAGAVESETQGEGCAAGTELRVGDHDADRAQAAAELALEHGAKGDRATAGVPGRAAELQLDEAVHAGVEA